MKIKGMLGCGCDTFTYYMVKIFWKDFKDQVTSQAQCELLFTLNHHPSSWKARFRFYASLYLLSYPANIQAEIK